MSGIICSTMAAIAAIVLLPAMASGQSVLSKAQDAVITKKIATSSAAEKQMVAGWSDGKKLAEFFCSEVGLKEIAKQHKGANRLFLGPDDERVGNSRSRAIGAWPATARCASAPTGRTSRSTAYWTLIRPSSRRLATR